MSELWMGVMPCPLEGVLILVQEGPGRTVLKALLPPPKHHAALGALCEGLSLWCGQKVRVAVSAPSPHLACDMDFWNDALAAADERVCEISVVVSPDGDDDPIRDRDELGDFDEVRAFARRWLAQ
jgi:hypothetical protein